MKNEVESAVMILFIECIELSLTNKTKKEKVYLFGL